MSGKRIITIVIAILLFFTGGGYLVQNWNGLRESLPTEVVSFADAMSQQSASLYDKVKAGASTILYGRINDSGKPGEMSPGAAKKVVVSPAGKAPDAPKVKTSQSGQSGQTGQSDTTPSVTAPRFGSMRLAREGGSVFSGTSAPGSNVTVEVNGRVLGRTNANQKGDWTLIIEEPMRERNYRFGLVSRGGGTSGKVERGSDVPLSFSPEDGGNKIITFSKSGIASIATKKIADLSDKASVPPAGGESGDAGATEGLFEKASELADAATEKFSQVLSGLNSGGDTEVVPGERKVAAASKPDTMEGAKKVEKPTARKKSMVLSFDKVTIKDAAGGRSSQLSLSGRSEPGAKIAIYLGYRTLGTARADASGRWSFSGQRNIPFGKSQLSAQHVGRDGKVLRRAEYSLKRVTPKTVVAVKKPTPLIQVPEKFAAIQKPKTQDVTAARPSTQAKAASKRVRARKTSAKRRARYKKAKRRTRVTRLASARKTSRKYRRAMRLGAASGLPKRRIKYSGRKRAGRGIAGRCGRGYVRYRVRRGDSLWRISKRFYGNGRRYRRIYKANKRRIRNPNMIYVKQRICIKR